MNTVSVSNIQVVEIEITLQDGHHLVNYNKIHKNKQAFVSSEKQRKIQINEVMITRMHCTIKVHVETCNHFISSGRGCSKLEGCRRKTEMHYHNY